MIRRNLVRALIFPALPLILTSCSGSNGRNAGTIEATSERIIRTFEEATGHELHRHSLSEKIRRSLGAPRMELLSFTRWVERPKHTLRSETDPLLARRYGVFTIFVCQDRFTRDDRLSGLKRYENGIYWREAVSERGPNAYKPYWVANKPYGEIVLLEWTSESGRRETSAQWDRLSALLEVAFR